MKKTYTKPAIVFESFSMSTNIAGDCDEIVGNPTQGSCGIAGSAPNLNVFSDINLNDATACHVPGDPNEVYDGFCYYVPTESYELFNS